jgi:hypothetical protein
MTTEDEMPWSAPWTVRREAADEAAFVEDVSGALYVPNAAPEIRMFAEVMAALDIPAGPSRGTTVAQLLAEERSQHASGEVVHLHRFAFGRRIAAVAAAVVAIGFVTVSAYAGVLPDSIQKVAHSVINAPGPKSEHDHNAPSSDTHNSPDVSTGNGSASNGGSGAPGSGTRSDARTTPAATAGPGAAQSTDVPNPHSSGSGEPASGSNNGHGHRTKTPPPSTPNPDSTKSPPAIGHTG